MRISILKLSGPTSNDKRFSNKYARYRPLSMCLDDGENELRQYEN